jgi:hypothetical protein
MGKPIKINVRTTLVPVNRLTWLSNVGQLTGNPAYHWDSAKDAPQHVVQSAKDSKFRAAYAAVGELVLITSALDHQLNHVLIHVLPLSESPMLEAVIATLDMVRKIEMLKARSKHIAQPTWRKPLLSYLDKLERISRWRNVACHTVLIPDSTHGAVFAPAAAAKLLKSLQVGDELTISRIPIADLKSAITLSESALGDGENLIENFQKVNAARVARFGK